MSQSETEQMFGHLRERRQNGGFDSDDFWEDLPFIGGTTYQELERYFNLGSQTDRSVMAMKQRMGEVPPEHPFDIALATGADIMGVFKGSKNVEGIHNKLFDQLYQKLSSMIARGADMRSGVLDNALAGFGVVMKAFHVESGPDFLDRFGGIQQQRVTAVLEGINLPVGFRSMSVLDRIKNDAPVIPKEQTNLNHLLLEFKERYVSFPIAFEDGAAFTHRMIEGFRDELWPKDSVPDHEGRVE